MINNDIVFLKLLKNLKMKVLLSLLFLAWLYLAGLSRGFDKKDRVNFLDLSSFIVLLDSLGCSLTISLVLSALMLNINALCLASLVMAEALFLTIA